MFEQASRLAIRFNTPKGPPQWENLWDLPLTSATSASLDNVAKSLSKQIKEADTESFVVKATKADEVLQLKFDIVKHIIEVRLAESEAAKQAKATKDQKQKILALIEQKKDEKLLLTPLEELEKLAESL